MNRSIPSSAYSVGTGAGSVVDIVFVFETTLGRFAAGSGAYLVSEDGFSASFFFPLLLTGEEFLVLVFPVVLTGGFVFLLLFIDSNSWKESSKLDFTPNSFFFSAGANDKNIKIEKKNYIKTFEDFIYFGVQQIFFCKNHLVGGPLLKIK